MTLSVGALSLLINAAHAQTTEMNTSDSLAMYKKEVKQSKKEIDAEKMNALENANRISTEKAKEAKRIQQEADTAAKESSDALKAEKKAQKARANADKQAQKASQAREKSNDN